MCACYKCKESNELCKQESFNLDNLDIYCPFIWEDIMFFFAILLNWHSDFIKLAKLSDSFLARSFRGNYCTHKCESYSANYSSFLSVYVGTKVTFK